MSDGGHGDAPEGFPAWGESVAPKHTFQLGGVFVWPQITSGVTVLHSHTHTQCTAKTTESGRGGGANPGR